MEFPNLGKQCNFASCLQLDFLPIECPYCKATFCKEHSSPLVHHCVEYNTAITKNQKESEKVRYVCKYKDCTKWELTAVVCPLCTLTFCLQHRLETDHDCTEYTPPVNKMAAAALVHSEIAQQMSAAPVKPRKMNKKAEKTAAKVKLMKLKLNSSGRSTIPADNRLYFCVLLPKSCNSDKSSIPVFVDQLWSIGRTIDEIADIGKVPNYNNIKGRTRLALYRSSDGECLSTLLDVKMTDLIKEDVILSGQTVILEYISNNDPSTQLENHMDYNT